MAEHASLDNKHKAASANSGASSPALSSGRSGSANSSNVHSPPGHGGLSGGLSQPAGWQSLLSFTILFLAWLAGFSSRLFAVIRFESIIHEFDPWFNYRSTHHLASHGFYEFLNWFDERAWYPLGRIVGGTVYPGLMVTAGLFHWILNMLNITVHIRDVCVFLAPVFSGLTSISTFLLTRELWNQGAGLLAACFIAIVPGYISRSVAGSFDNEGIAIFALQFTYYLWVSSWIFLFPVAFLHALAEKQYAKIHIPIIASVSEHQPTTWVSFFFDLHILVCTFPAGLWFCIKNINDERVFVALYAISAVYFAGVMVRLMLTLTPVVCMLSAIAFSNVFEHYLGDDMKRENPPVEDSSDEDDKKNQQNLYDKAGKVRKHVSDQEKTEEGLGPNIKSIVTMLMLMLLMMFAVHCTWVTSNAYSSPSVVLASYNHDGTRNILDDFREAYYWLRQNTDEHARVMSWWDYGYQIAGMANRTTLVDNNTWNNSHIALVGKAMSSNETAAYEIMRSLDVDYVLIIFGGVIGYSGDDINKFLWMVRIAEGEHPKDIRESDYFTPQGEFRVDKAGSPTLLNCLMYKMSYYRFGEMQTSKRKRGYVKNKLTLKKGKKPSKKTV
ncbi:dolichyl-diphosphooligosaccharide--protein glycosyltransferase subunit STT3B [Bombina bombina]|uniref:dolichyl-diphosphooligosaccharide--protein glycosyltransferase subunit STT3B n=1 Tax=Bombina bombina TaxID=8345 RepID=UPI00235AFEC7|nr:dolichyl-diphosphooligosaccharide--protein glycosyltransferase subunit STT3B [Bombina bombina]